MSAIEDSLGMASFAYVRLSALILQNLYMYIRIFYHEIAVQLLAWFITEHGLIATPVKSVADIMFKICYSGRFWTQW